jgi:hypothetical protein
VALIRVNQNPSRRELRQFAAIWFPLFWVLIAGVVYVSAGSATTAAALATIGLLIGGFGVSRPAFMLPIYLGWMYAAYPMGWLISHLVLGVVFYLVVSPIGLLMRLVGYDPMRRRFGSSELSHWVKCEEIRSKRYYFRQY